MVGSYTAADGTTRGFLLQQPTGGSPATILDLGDLGQSGCLQYVWPNALNDLDQVAGNEYLLPPAGAQGTIYTQGFFWDAGMVLVDASDLSANWTAVALSADGQVVGRYGLGSDSAAPFATAGSFLWDGDSDFDLGSLGGGAGADAFAVLEGGLAFGTSLAAADGALHLFQAARPTNLGGFKLADWGSVSLYAGDTSFVPVSLSAATVKAVSTTITPDAVGPHPPRSAADYSVAGFGTDAGGNTRALLWNNLQVHSVVDLLPASLSFVAVSSAYGSRVLVNGYQQIACAGTDTGGHQLALLLSVDPDTDNDGLPDSWEMRYYGHLGVDKNALEASGGGLTNWEAYEQGSNPVDFYAGQPPPSLTLVSGNGQSAAPGSFLPAPLVVQVADAGGTPLAGAPVTFSVGAGGGQLQASRQGSPKTTLTLLTDGNGQAQVFFRVPGGAAAGSASTVNALLPGAGALAATTFSETADPNGPANPAPVDPNTPPPTPQPVPTQSYAAVDLSGGLNVAPNNNSVVKVALDDDGNAAFGYTDSSLYLNNIYTYAWKNGVLGPQQVTYSSQTNPPGIDVPALYGDFFVSPKGDVFGSEYVSTPYLDGYVSIEGTYQSVGGQVMVSNIPAPSDPEGGPYVYETTLSACAENGVFAGGGHGYDDTQHPIDWNYVCVGGHYTVFDGNDFSLYATSSDVTLIAEGFGITAVNSTGQAVGGSSTYDATSDSYLDASLFWDGTKLNTVSSHLDIGGLNDQGQVVGGGYYGTEGYLWEQGNKTVLVDHLPAELQGQIATIQPCAVSNQTAPGTDATIYILATANVTQPDGTVTQGATIVCTRDNEGDWSFAQVGLPDGTTVNQYTTINSSGVIAGIGNTPAGESQQYIISNRGANPSQDPSPTAQQQALLFAAIKLTAQVQPGPATVADGATTNQNGTTTLTCPRTTLRAVLNKVNIKQNVADAGQLKIVQDAKGTATITYFGGTLVGGKPFGESSTTCTISIASNGQPPTDPHPDGYIADDDARFHNIYSHDPAGNLVCELNDAPNLSIGYLPRQQVKSLTYSLSFRDYVQIPNASGPASTVEEVDWSFSMTVAFDRQGFSTGTPVKLPPTANPTDLPGNNQPRMGGKVAHAPVPRPPEIIANTFLNTAANWKPAGDPNGYAYRAGFNPFIRTTP